MPEVSTVSTVLTWLSYGQGGLLFLLVIAAAVTDLSGKRIPNGFCLGAVVAGLCLSYMRGGLMVQANAGVDWGSVSLLTSLVAMAIGFAIFFFFYLIGGLGAGDVKLMAAVGALVANVSFLLWVIMATAFAGVPLAVTVLLFRRDLKGGLSRSARGMFRWKYNRGTAEAEEASVKAEGATNEPTPKAEASQAKEETKSAKPKGEEEEKPPVVMIPYAVATALGVFATIWLFASRHAWDQIPFF